MPGARCVPLQATCIAAKPRAQVIVLAALGGSIVAINFGSLITGLYAFGLLLGTVYSVPPLRLKVCTGLHG